MKTKLYLDILPQPDDTTCGPTSLHAVYRYFGDSIPLDQVISEVRPLEDGGTMAVYLAHHALDRGYRVTIYTYNLQVFDPTWFGRGDRFLFEKLSQQLRYRDDPKLRETVQAYLEFIDKSGKVRFEDLTAQLIRRYLNRSIPILTGLLSTYLYQCARETVDNFRLVSDDLRGEPTGHFVVLSGYDKINLSNFHLSMISIHRLASCSGSSPGISICPLAAKFRSSVFISARFGFCFMRNLKKEFE
jgi:hypothetical protein